MTKKLPPLLVQTKRLSALKDAEQAAAEVGLPVPPEDALSLLWLTLAVHRAGLGFPPDPLRARGWLRFGRPLDEGEEPAVGDVGIAAVGTEYVAGVISAAGERIVTLQVGPGDGMNVGTGELLTTRRPIQLRPDGGNV